MKVYQSSNKPPLTTPPPHTDTEKMCNVYKVRNWFCVQEVEGVRMNLPNFHDVSVSTGSIIPGANKTEEIGAEARRLTVVRKHSTLSE